MDIVASGVGILIRGRGGCIYAMSDVHIRHVYIARASRDGGRGATNPPGR